MAKKKKGTKKAFRREAAELYATINKIVENPGKLSDEKLIAKIAKWLGKQQYNCSNAKCKGESEEFNAPTKAGKKKGKYIQDDDTFCWFCGDDVSENSDGGYDVAAAKLAEEPEDKEKEEPEEAEEEEAEEPEDEEETEKEEEAEEEVEDPEEEVEEPEDEEETEKEEEAEEVPLDDRIATIRSFSANTGASAWEIGAHLSAIVTTRQYKTAGHKTFDVFCSKELDMTRQNAYIYIRIAEAFDKEDAGKLSIFKLDLLTKVKDEKDRNKLLKAAMPKDDGGKGLDNSKLKAKVSAAREKAGESSRSPGRPAASTFKRLVGTAGKSTEVSEKGKNLTVWLDDEVGIEFARKKSGKWGWEFIAAEE